MVKCRVKKSKKYSEEKDIDVLVEFSRVPYPSERITLPSEIYGDFGFCVKEVIHVWNSAELGYAAELICFV